ncbi:MULTISPECIES: hypothetical protein [Gracilibacillus]|uniref:Uncharacterized protein n=1 Tax=Gracilibacillus dipsosauri TaxID=178340 RepID=A0A317KUW2_9BACI|nr:hypothetical protein [Gracilibacillus dipsosauri]PWU67332.1 hypothetical protein DLJ74_16085 [Gracilibacillus dipsosauri]
MYSFLAEYSPTCTALSILDKDGMTLVTREVHIPKPSFVKILTREMIQLAHEQQLFHNDISKIGVVIDSVESLNIKIEQFIEDLETSFGFQAEVGLNKDSVKSSLLDLKDK